MLQCGRKSQGVQGWRNKVRIEKVQPHTHNVKEAPVHDALPRPGPKLDARMNDRQGEKPRGTSPERLSKPARPGQMHRRKEAKGARVRSTDLNHRPRWQRTLE